MVETRLTIYFVDGRCHVDTYSFYFCVLEYFHQVLCVHDTNTAGKKREYVGHE